MLSIFRTLWINPNMENRSLPAIYRYIFESLQCVCPGVIGGMLCGLGEAKLRWSIKMIPLRRGGDTCVRAEQIANYHWIITCCSPRYHCPDSGNKLVMSKYLLCRNGGIEPSSQMFSICKDQSRSFLFDTCIAGSTLDEFSIPMWFVDCVTLRSKGENKSFYFSCKPFTGSIRLS